MVSFFVLSGFLITWLLLEEQDKYGEISLSNFYRRRALRILPPFFAYAIFYIAFFLLVGRPVPWIPAICAIFYVSNYYFAFGDNPNSGFGHTWSLSVEEQFYFLWPLFLIFLLRRRERMVKYLFLLIVAVWVYRAMLSIWFEVGNRYLHAAFDARMDQLAVGCLVAILLYDNKLKAFWEFVCSKVLFSVGVLTALFASVYFGTYIYSKYAFSISSAVEPLLIAILMIQIVRFSASALWRWLDWRPVRYIGRISYSLYLYQAITIHSVRRALDSQPVFVQLGAVLIVTLCAGTISHFLVERPFLKLKKLTSSNRSLSHVDD